MGTNKTLNGGSNPSVKPPKKRWSKDDTELFLLAANFVMVSDICVHADVWCHYCF